MAFRLILGCLGTMCIAFSGLKAQKPTHLHFNFDQGLASNSVYRMLQSRDGYLYFATASGLSRFDGVRFQNYAFEDGLTSNDVLTLYEDSKGRLWMLPYLKTICYLLDGKIHNPKTDSVLGQLQARNFFTSIIEDAQHNIWLGDDKGLFYKVDPQGRVTKKFEMVGEEIRNFAALFLNTRGEPMAVTNSALYDLGRGLVADTLQQIPNRWSAPMSVPIGQDSHLVVMGQYFILVHDGQMTKLDPPWENWGLMALHTEQDSRGGLWISTSSGAYRFEGVRVENGQVTFRDSLHVLADKSVTAVYEDHEGNFWLSTVSDGVYFLPSIGSSTYDVSSDGGTSFANKVFCDKRGRVWVGFDGSTFGLLEQGKWSLQRLPPKNSSRGRTNDIYEDQEGNVILVTDQNVLIKTPAGKEVLVPRGGKSVVQSPQWGYILSHSWTVDTLGRISVSGFEAAFTERLKTTKDDLFLKRCPSLAVDKAGKLYAGTLEGLYERRGDSFGFVAGVPKLPISKVALAPDGKLWVTTTVDGAGYLEGGQFHPITRAEGLPSNICNDICFAADRAVWLATNGGISRIMLPSNADGELQIRNFSRGAGLASDEVRSVAVSSDQVFAATSRGLTVLGMSTLTAQPPKVLVRIEDFSANGKDLTGGAGKIQLSSTDNHVSVRFTGISFRNADKLKFQFQLASGGEAGKWVSTTGRQLEFPELRPGTYKLSIRSTVEGHPESMGEASLEWEVLPAFYQTRWFLLLLILAIGCVLIGGFLLAFRRLRKQELKRSEVRRRIAETEQKALRAQMNPHFIFNSLNSIEQFFLSNRPQEANAFIADFSDLMRTILEYSAHSSIPLSEELRFLRLFLSVERQRMGQHRFSFSVEMDPEIDAEEVMVPPMILQPFAENSVWHGISLLTDRPGMVSIRVLAVPTGVDIVLEDNGIGRQRSEELKSKYRQKHKSSGLRITMDRLELLNLDRPLDQCFSVHIEDLHEADGTASGTRVTLHIPTNFSIFRS